MECQQCDVNDILCTLTYGQAHKADEDRTENK
jgi:hypothetical protein